MVVLRLVMIIRDVAVVLSISKNDLYIVRFPSLIITAYSYCH